MMTSHERRFSGWLLAVLASLGLGAVGWRLAQGDSVTTRSAIARIGGVDRQIAARGRVEGISEQIKLGARLPGRVRAVLVGEGDTVRKGQLLLAFENADLHARVGQEQASVRKAEAQLALLLSGARPEERAGAQADVEEAEANSAKARLVHERSALLYADGIVAREQADQSANEKKSADARLVSAEQKHRLFVTGARPEERQAARAEVALARARWEEARALLDQSLVFSPIDGIVIKKYVAVGASVTFQDVGAPLLSLADTSSLLVRAEVDEADVAHVQVGQPAAVTAPAFGTETFSGRVVRLGGGLGRQDIQSDSPTEKVDTEILEVLVALEHAATARMKVGLRVDVRIRVAHAENVLVVPAESISRKLDGAYVQVRGDDGWVERRVVVGAADSAVAEIRSGLRLGDVVAF